MGLGMIGIAVAGAIVLTAKNALFTPIYGAYLLGQQWWVFLLCMLPGIGGFIIVATTGFVTAKSGEISNLFYLLTVFACISAGYLAVAWFIFLNKTDRRWLINLLPQFVNAR